MRYRRCVSAVRRLFAQRYLVALLCAATLLLKLLVPTGYMIGNDHGRLAIVLCPGVVSAAEAMAMPGMHDAMPDHGKKDHGKAEMPCAFSGLSAAALGTIDGVQLAALIAYIMAVGLCLAVVPTPIRRIHLRPPLRGPPATL